MLFLPWSLFESSGGEIGRPVGKPTPSKTSSSPHEERSFPEPTEEQLLKFLVGKRSKRRLAGPNSSIITIWVFPKWNALLKELPEPVQLVDSKFKSRCPWRCRIFSDMVSGLWHARTVQDQALLLEGQPAENEFLDLNKIKISMFLPVANGGRIGVCGGIGGLVNRFLYLGFHYHKKPEWFLAEFADFDGVLGVLMLDDVLNELLRIESIAIGASLENPLRSGRIREYDFSSEVDEGNPGALEALKNKCALRYESAFNPIGDLATAGTWLQKGLLGSHIFENGLVAVAVKYQGNAGAFTRISKYSNLSSLEHDEFEVVYLESTPERISKMSGIRKNLRDVWIFEHNFSEEFSEEAIEKGRREFSGKQKSLQERARSLVHGLSTANIETSEWLSYLGISFYLREAYKELAHFGRSCQIGKWNVKVAESTQPDDERNISLEHPKGRIVIKESKVTGRSDDSSPLGYPAWRLALEVNGGGVLEVLYHEGTRRVHDPFSHDPFSKGKILTHSSLMWLGEFLGPMLEMKLSEEYFEARVNRGREKKANRENEVGKLTKQEEAASKPGDSEPLGP